MVSMKFISAVTLMSLFQQAHRSIAHAMPPVENSQWLHMLDYYKGNRLDNLRKSLEYLLELARSSQSQAPVMLRLQLNRRISVWRVWIKFSFYFSSKRHCCFATDEISFLTVTMAKLLKVLEGELISDKDTVVLRDDLSLSLKLFFFRCPALQKIKKITYIENYNMPDFITHYTLEEIVGSVS